MRAQTIWLSRSIFCREFMRGPGFEAAGAGMAPVGATFNLAKRRAPERGVHNSTGRLQSGGDGLPEPNGPDHVRIDGPDRAADVVSAGGPESRQPTPRDRTPWSLERAEARHDSSLARVLKIRPGDLLDGIG